MGRFLLVVGLTLCVSGSSAAADRPWSTASSPHFTVISDDGPKTAREAASSLESCNVMITGSNMSGKLTFLGTGVNAVLAQTINTCLADEYTAPVFRVRTCIGRAVDRLSYTPASRPQEVRACVDCC